MQYILNKNSNFIFKTHNSGQIFKCFFLFNLQYLSVCNAYLTRMSSLTNTPFMHCMSFPFTLVPWSMPGSSWVILVSFGSRSIPVQFFVSNFHLHKVSSQRVLDFLKIIKLFCGLLIKYILHERLEFRSIKTKMW